MFGVCSFLCSSSETLQLVEFGGRKVPTIEESNAGGSKIVPNACLELFTSLH